MAMCLGKKAHHRNGIRYAHFERMVLIVATLAAAVGLLAVVLNHLRKAPLGYEDEQGFHIVQQVKGSAILRYPKPRNVAAGSLKSARVHP